MNWLELHEFLQQMVEDEDPRLTDEVIVYNSDVGEYFPGDLVVFENEEDPVIAKDRLFIMTSDWKSKI